MKKVILDKILMPHLAIQFLPKLKRGSQNKYGRFDNYYITITFLCYLEFMIQIYSKFFKYKELKLPLILKKLCKTFFK